MPTVTKSWGREKWIVNNSLYCLKEMILLKDSCCSIHYHHVKDETFYCVVGEMLLSLNGEIQVLKAGDVARIMPGIQHSFYGVDSTSFFEVSTHHDDYDVARVTNSKKYIDEVDWRLMVSKNAYGKTRNEGQDGSQEMEKG